jgi:hypothetical protein
MGKFQVTTATVFEFEAESREDARWMVENGEMPSNHTMEDAYILAIQDMGGVEIKVENSPVPTSKVDN